ncbi:MAG: hypothetical protein QM730_14145 [Anaerolineales bacterium]
MQRVRIALVFLILLVLFMWTNAPTYAAPLAATALQEGRTYDQAHDLGYIDWSGPVQYLYITHRDGSSLPPEEGGAYCTPNCSEWVTRLSNGSSASGSFDRNVSYFEVMVGFSPNSNVGNATLRACSSVNTWTLYSNSGAYAGFVSMDIPVPAGCRSWSLTASSGYVDFRSIDVYYVVSLLTATPTSSPTPTFTSTAAYTPTATLTPSLAPTLTHTPTQTFTPTVTDTQTPSSTPTQTFTSTATYTHTPSSTPTPLPPNITGVVVCDRWGDAGWCRGNETLELSATDPQGFSVTITGDLNGEPFVCGSSCDLPLSEGMGAANYMATSTSGRTAGGSSTWQRDAAPPDLEISLPPIDGRNGWYVSEVDLFATATDVISGLSSLLASMDGGLSWVTLPIHFTDGDHSVLIHARDAAGNDVTVSRVIRVDTVLPVAQITFPSSGDIVQGNVSLTGSLVDVMSGPENGEISVDGGNTWQAVLMDAEGDWSYLWHSGEVPNGEYAVQIWSRDRAGNIGEVVSIALNLDNGSPTVSITKRWWIWESGSLIVSPNHFPITSIQVTILDPQNRWLAASLDYASGKNSYIVTWDRYFKDRTFAPSGEYAVVAEVCDENGLCGHDTGMILIPEELATSTATLTPIPTATSTPEPTVTPTATSVPPASTIVLITPIPESSPEAARPSLPLWQVIGLLGLFTGIASASVVDPRPKALKRLSETFKDISVRSKDDLIENK